MARSALAASSTMLRRVLFLGSDNHCHSRFCEELFNHEATAQSVNWLAFSRALRGWPATLNRGPMSSLAVEQLEQRGIRPTNHLRLPLEVTHFDFSTADRVIALDETRDRPLLDARWLTFAPVVCYWPPAPTDAVFRRLEARVKALLRDILIGSRSPAFA